MVPLPRGWAFVFSPLFTVFSFNGLSPTLSPTSLYTFCCGTLSLVFARPQSMYLVLLLPLGLHFIISPDIMSFLIVTGASRLDTPPVALPVTDPFHPKSVRNPFPHFPPAFSGVLGSSDGNWNGILVPLPLIFFQLPFSILFSFFFPFFFLNLSGFGSVYQSCCVQTIGRWALRPSFPLSWFVFSSGLPSQLVRLPKVNALILNVFGLFIAFVPMGNLLPVFRCTFCSNYLLPGSSRSCVVFPRLGFLLSPRCPFFPLRDGPPKVFAFPKLIQIVRSFPLLSLFCLMAPLFLNPFLFSIVPVSWPPSFCKVFLPFHLFVRATPFNCRLGAHLDLTTVN